jgi:hypothetical protein
LFNQTNETNQINQTNQMDQTNQPVPALARLMAGQWKQGAIPPKWDGKAAGRIVGHLERLLVSTSVESYFAPYAEPLSEARTPHGKRRVSEQRGGIGRLRAGG